MTGDSECEIGGESSAFRNPHSAICSPRVAVIGGGMSGLAAAHRLTERLPAVELVLFEAGDRVGGILDTLHADGFLIERSADNFLTRMPWAVDLCGRIGLGDQLLATNAAHRRAFVVHRGRLQPVPEGFVLMEPRRLWSVMRSPILSPVGKFDLLRRWWLANRRRNVDQNRPPGDESVASFARRQLGKQAFERLVQPLVGGIYAGDAERLSMAATMPQFFEQRKPQSRKPEEETMRLESGARYGMFQAPRLGMSSLIDALVARLPAGAIRLGTPVSRVTCLDRVWLVSLSSQASPQEFDAVILATPAHASARLLAEMDAELAARLGEIEYAGSVVVSLGFRREQIQHRLDGFGVVVPRSEGRRIIAASFASIKFPGRAPEGHVVVRVFVGGALQPELVELADDQLADLAHEELASLVGLSGRAELMDVARWPAAMPQYDVGHLDRVRQIEELASRHRGLELAGNAFRGVGIPQCIHSGEQAAERIADGLSTRQQ